jgi:hypothetical protein
LSSPTDLRTHFPRGLKGNPVDEETCR